MIRSKVGSISPMARFKSDLNTAVTRSKTSFGIADNKIKDRPIAISPITRS